MPFSPRISSAALVRSLAVVFVILALAACSAAPAARSESAAPIDPVVQFLITSAATDFHTHRPPDPVRFRDVRVGHTTAEGRERYMLCGQFQTADGSEWTPFVTIKTSGYEQYIGNQGKAFCQGSSVVWDKTGDLSASLQSRLDSLK